MTTQRRSHQLEYCCWRLSVAAGTVDFMDDAQHRQAWMDRYREDYETDEAAEIDYVQALRTREEMNRIFQLN